MHMFTKKYVTSKYFILAVYSVVWVRVSDRSLEWLVYMCLH